MNAAPKAPWARATAQDLSDELEPELRAWAEALVEVLAAEVRAAQARMHETRDDGAQAA